MQYTLSVLLHNLYFELAIVDESYNITSKKRYVYDRNKDISRNIHLAYIKDFGAYDFSNIGVGISSGITYKDGIIYRIASFNLDRYHLKQSLDKLFNRDIPIYEEDDCACLAIAKSCNIDSLFFVNIDGNVSSSLLDKGVIKDLNLLSNENINKYCSIEGLKPIVIKKHLDDDYLGTYFLSNSLTCKEIIKGWASHLSEELSKVIESNNITTIAFSGGLGELFDTYKEYLSLPIQVRAFGINSYKDMALLGISYFINKDTN